MLSDPSVTESPLHPSHTARNQSAESPLVRGLREELEEFRSSRSTRRPPAHPTASPTSESRQTSPPEAAAPSVSQPPVATLSSKQADLLRTLVLASEPVVADTLDGRVLRALQGRGFAEVVDRRVVVTETGRSYFNTHVRRRRRVGARPEETAEGSAREQRAEAIRRAATILEQVLPAEDRVEVGWYRGTAAEVVEGFRALADVVARGGLIVGA